MNFARQTTHNQQKQQTLAGSLPRRRAEDEPTLSRKSVYAFSVGSPMESVRGVPGPSPGLWDLASQSERRGFASSSSEYPRKSQRPGVAMPQQSKPLAPPSWGGQTTYNTTHKNNRVYRPGRGSGTPPATLLEQFPAVRCQFRSASEPEFRSGLRRLPGCRVVFLSEQ